mgnify:CR=1 FL=1
MLCYHLPKENDEIIGNATKVKIVKNKVAPPFKVVEFEIIYGEGISQVGEIVDLGVDLDILNKSGSWYSYNDEKIGQGKENTKQYLLQNLEEDREYQTIWESISILEQMLLKDIVVGSKEKFSEEKIKG